jgi:hypothetical protein
MGQISRDAFKKLVLLYLVGKFKDGVYSSYRFQKVLYFATKDSDIHPFEFQYTRNGQYSYNARKNLDALDAIGLVKRTHLAKCEDAGAKWNVERSANSHTQLFKVIAPNLANSIDIGIDKYGYLKREDLIEQAHLDDLLRKAVRGQILFEENLPIEIDVNLSDEDCFDLELSLNPNFVNTIRTLIRGVESGEIPLEQWRKVDA